MLTSIIDVGRNVIQRYENGILIPSLLHSESLKVLQRFIEIRS